MNATHTFSLPLHANSRRIEPCVNRYWIAVPLTKTVIGLWKVLSDVKQPPVELNGHSKEINALAFSINSSGKYLVSSCKEKILLWNLDANNDGPIHSHHFFSNPGEVTAICINNNDDLVAVGVDFNVLLLKSGHKEPVAVLSAHRGMLTGLSFCPHYSATLVSISDDRSFCVWDVKDMLLLYRSVIISPAPLISLNMNLTRPHVAIGTADGCLKIFDLTDGNDFRQLASIDVASTLAKHFEQSLQEDKSKPRGPVIVSKRGKEPNQDFDLEEAPTIVQSSESILSVEYAYFAQETTESPNLSAFMAASSGAGDVLGGRPPAICIITSNALLQINSNTLEISNVINLQRPVRSLTFNSSKTVGSIAYAASGQIGPSQMLAVVGTMFERRIDVIHWNVMDGEVQSNSGSLDSKDFADTGLDDDGALSVIPAAALLSSSPLKAEMHPPVASSPITKGDVATGKKKSLGVMNQPLTFKSQIKSSGYSQSPKTSMFKPETSRKKLLNITDQRKPKQEKLKASGNKMLKADYDTKRGPPAEHCDTFQVDQQTTAVFALRFSDDGNGLSCALSNKCGLVLKSPYSKQLSTSFVGHNNLVNSMCWSSDSTFLLSASNDKTVSMWEKAGGDPVMTLTHQKGTPKEIQANRESSTSLSKTSSSASNRKLSTSSSGSSLSSLSSSNNAPFTKEIKRAQFFYVDKFILLTHGPELCLYKYYVTPDRDEIKRYQSRNHYKLVSSWQTSSSSFTASSAANTFFSHLVICTTSGRNMEVYDLNRSVLAHTFDDCHSRPAHCIAMNEGSCFASQPSEAHNVIATIAPTDPIKLWDVRSRSNVQALQGHLNKAHACQIAFSPCGNYLASGSEDKVVYIYDLRTGTYCERLRGHNDVVTGVAFHPAYPLLASGSLNGKILFFKAK